MPNKVIEIYIYIMIYITKHKHIQQQQHHQFKSVKYKLIVNVSIVNLKKSARISSEIVHLMVAVDVVVAIVNVYSYCCCIYIHTNRMSVISVSWFDWFSASFFFSQQNNTKNFYSDGNIILNIKSASTAIKKN